MTAAIRFDGVSLRYATGTLALEDVSFDVPRGQLVALVGPSGCGKSTALRLAAGLEAPTTGAVHVDPGPEAGPQPVAFVFQDATLLPWRRIADNVALPLRMRGEAAGSAREAALRALARVGLDGFSDHYPRELSGGMRMRASLARALVTRPRVMLLDEPFGALDEITRQKLQEDLLGLREAEGFTAVMVTHSVFEAVYTADRVLVMSPRPGRIAADLPVELPSRGPDLRADPAFARAVGDVGQALRSQL